MKEPNLRLTAIAADDFDKEMESWRAPKLAFLEKGRALWLAYWNAEPTQAPATKASIEQLAPR